MNILQKYNKVIKVTIFATIVEWVLYLLFGHHFALTVQSSQAIITTLFMLGTNAISARIAKYIFTGK